MDEYGPLIEALVSFEPPAHVFGGFAEDALLQGTSVRTHHDVDVLVGRDELEAQLRNAQAIGFSSREVRYEPIEGMPMVIGTTNGHLDLEISVYDRTPEGTVFFHLLDQDGRLVRIDLSDGVFDHPPCRTSTASLCGRCRRSRYSRSALESPCRVDSDQLVRRTSLHKMRFAPGSSPAHR